MGKITIKNSDIHGLGIYVTDDIKKGEVVIRWENTRELSKSECDALPIEEHAYIEKSGDKIFLMGKPERYVNHSCNANTTPGEKCDIANRDINIGEEITTDYGNFYIPDKIFNCSCQSINCRRLITGKKAILPYSCRNAQDQTLSYSMVMLVGKFIRYLGTCGTKGTVYRIMSRSLLTSAKFDLSQKF